MELNNWLGLSKTQQIEILRELTSYVPMPEVAIEKDW